MTYVFVLQSTGEERPLHRSGSTPVPVVALGFLVVIFGALVVISKGAILAAQLVIPQTVVHLAYAVGAVALVGGVLSLGSASRRKGPVAGSTTRYLIVDERGIHERGAGPANVVPWERVASIAWRTGLLTVNGRDGSLSQRGVDAGADFVAEEFLRFCRERIAASSAG